MSGENGASSSLTVVKGKAGGGGGGGEDYLRWRISYVVCISVRADEGEQKVVVVMKRERESKR